MGEKRIDSLDFLRGIAILGTILVHSFQGVEGNISNMISIIFLFGATGCQLFFLVSGFCLSQSMESKRESLTRFYYKRFCGVAPIYYIVIIFYIFLNRGLQYFHGYIGFQQNTDTRAVLNNIFLVHGFLEKGHNDVVPGGWYIGVACFFYLLFPFIMYMLKKMKRRWIMAVIPCGVFVLDQILVRYILKDFLNLIHLNEVISYKDILYNLPVFIMGIVINLYYRAGKLELSGKKLKLCKVAAGILFVIAVFDYYGAFINYQFFAGLFYGTCLIVLLNCTPHKSKIYQKIVLMGKASYAIYFVHIPFLIYLMPILFFRFAGEDKKSGTLFFLLLLLIMVPCIYLVGRSCQKVINKISGKLANVYQ